MSYSWCEVRSTSQPNDHPETHPLHHPLGNIPSRALRGGGGHGCACITPAILGAPKKRGIFCTGDLCAGGKFCTGNIPHLSQKTKDKIPHLRNLECIGSKGILGLRSLKDTQYSKAASNNSADV